MELTHRLRAVGGRLAAAPRRLREGPSRDQLAAEIDGLRGRVQTLESQVRELRGQHQRVAELTDVVQELLLPMSRRDQEAVDDILQRYADELGS